jgi:hypothetical protein
MSSYDLTDLPSPAYPSNVTEAVSKVVTLPLIILLTMMMADKEDWLLITYHVPQ